MNPRDTHEQIGLFSSIPSPTGEAVAAIRAEAAAARDRAIAGLLRRAFAGIGTVLAVVGSALLAWPQRRAAYQSLRALSDRELADIGLKRGDIARVFEPDFRMPSRPANTNRMSAGSRAQAA